ncbi:MAG: hypothetical protein OEN55_06905 [Alphaproteobacteria bacterium]|nr:hypothetical protein [Alphaproteobacteria bacterium]
MSIGTPPRASRHRSSFHGLAILIAALALAGCTTTLTESHTGGTGTNESIKLDAANSRVVLMPIDIRVTELTAAGLEEPKADWTEAARNNVTAALNTTMAEHGLTLRQYKKPKGAKRVRRDDQLEKLHSTVGGTILVHHYSQMNRLPTKQGQMDWTLGRTARQLGNDQNAEFALFVFMRDSYATSGRKAAMVASTIVGSILGTRVAKAGERIGFASLVDLRNGNVVWFNVLYSDTGDIRQTEPAREVVDDLISGFPI